MDTSFDKVLEQAEKIHFIGIGGSGMCPLAEILLSEGKKIHGSDVDNESDTVNRIRSLGVEVLIGHRPENIGDAELVVYTAAVQKDNPELLAAKERGIPTVERSILLGAVCRRYPRTIAVSGTHGKTTTTSMITTILVNTDLDPSIIIGGKLPLIGSNGRAGKSDLMVCEACEFVDTFLQITPDCAVILNIDADHLEYFGSVENIIKSFNKFSNQTGRRIIVNGDDANSLKAVEGVNAEIVTFGINNDCDFVAKDIRINDEGHWEFNILKQGNEFCSVALRVPGHHNIYNALASAAAADYAGATPEQISYGLDTFAGAKRRYDVHTVTNNITIADDYAHHPTELEAILRACKEQHFDRVWAVFQPFTYTRTKDHMDEFAQVLQIADKVVLTEIMAAREIDDLGVNSEQLRSRIPGAVLLESFEAIADYVIENAQPGDLVLTMGCGDIYKCAKLMTEKIKAKYN
ncbi:MAG: UDP-N-acetylmuramate--L-alanine ligase [Ruminococcaceae bacterium]|nr:UDP-N-acetylmuramate--L-alanine ligase [Oscillospiraceae bacterium]